ncbi:hypothetical protein CQW39_09460 [Streptomyces griseofuscus]|uniref:hypothetical protein n=1 Tax=Streptomyces griseofuscus TaxID=146922 RepID=UPI000F64CE4F|nr:hypothetical protein [Streptomyces griseofuscus]RRQ79367.1 hypothetical protein CQW39_09460 [Streptomyces griseofuscus]
MSAQPTERPLTVTDFDRQAGNELAVSALLDYLPLPAAAMTPRPDAVHITVVSAHDLSHWMYDLGGRIVRDGGADGVTLWTLHTSTPERGDGSSVPIRVHAAVIDGEDVLAEVRPGGVRL